MIRAPGHDDLVPVEKKHYVPHRILLKVVGGTRERFIHIPINPELTQAEQFLILFLAAQTEIQKFAAQGIQLRTTQILDLKNRREVRFPMELLTQVEQQVQILSALDLQEIPRDLYWPMEHYR